MPRFFQTIFPPTSYDISTLLISDFGFNGQQVTLNGFAPPAAATLAGGVNSATWVCTFTNGVNATVFANGLIDNNSGCALLPFTPQFGCIYTMNASLTASANTGIWVGASPASGQSTPETVVFYNYTAPVLIGRLALAPGLAEQPPVLTITTPAKGKIGLTCTYGFAGDTWSEISDPT